MTRYRDYIKSNQSSILTHKLAVVTRGHLERYDIENVVSTINNNYSGTVDAVKVYKESPTRFAKAITLRHRDHQGYWLHGDGIVGRETTTVYSNEEGTHKEFELKYPDFDMDTVNIVITITQEKTTLHVYLPTPKTTEKRYLVKPKQHHDDGCDIDLTVVDDLFDGNPIDLF